MALGDSLSPWDAIPYFQTPRETVFFIVPGTPTQVAKLDPNRVALIFSGGTPAIYVSTRPDVVTGAGLILNTNSPRLEITQAEYGPLVNLAWYAASVGAGDALVVIEVAIQKWPRRMYDDLIAGPAQRQRGGH